MKIIIRSLLILAVFSLSAAAQSEAILRQARSYLGGDAALGAIQSVHYKGKLTTVVTSATGEEATAQAEITITFGKPYFQRIEITAPDKSEITALDDYEAWQRVQNPENPAQWRMTLLDAAQVRRLRANTWENLNFFNDVTKIGGRIEDFGLVDMDGRKLHKMAFIHSPAVVFYRFFDPTTGRLVVTQTDSGAEIREAGEQMTAGVKFPGQVVTTSVRPDGVKQVVSVTFESVSVNDGLDRSQFQMPSVTGG